MSRVIQDQMFFFIEKRLMDNGLAQLHIKNRNPRGLLVEAARVLVGIKELTGNNDGFEVSLIQKTVDGKAQREAYCMATQQTLIAYVERKLGIISPLLATEHCTTLWNWVVKNHPELLVKWNPLPGALAIWKHGDAPVETKPPGHTEMVLDADEKIFHAVGGNTSGWTTYDAAEAGKRVNRDGNGVYYTVRSRKGEGEMQLVGFIKPF